MERKVCLITGASSGIGKATALALAVRGFDLVLLCRDRARGEAARAEILTIEADCRVDLLIANLARPEDVRGAAASFLAMSRPLHVLVNNAGLLMRRRRETRDGFEMTFAVNHLGHFLLTNLLLDCMRESEPARIVNVASRLHRIGEMHFEDLHYQARRYRFLAAYGQSKLANILFTRELARRLAGSGVTANAATPGLVASGFGRNNPGLTRLLAKTVAPLLRTPERGAETIFHLCDSPVVEGVTGRYFADCKEEAVSDGARSDVDAAKLWQVSEVMTGLRG